jgi:hypothetical protein
MFYLRAAKVRLYGYFNRLLAGWINQQQEDVIDYLRDLRERLARLPRYYYRDAA